MNRTNKLTEQAIKRAKPKDKQYKLTDGDSMYLRIYPDGKKYWQLQFRFEGKQKVLSFGKWPNVKLPEARASRYEANKKIKEGINPLDEKRFRSSLHIENYDKNKRLEENKGWTFQQVAQEWHFRQETLWTKEYSKVVFSSLIIHVFPYLGEIPIVNINKRDVISMLKKLEVVGKHETCYRIRQRLESIFNYAKTNELCINNPAKGLNKTFVKPEPKSHSSIPISEFPEFLSRMKTDKVTNLSTVLAMNFLILTFVRSSELRFADWSEFDIDCAEPLWVIPSTRMKMRGEHYVPLSSQAVCILKEMQEYSGKNGYVFTQVRNSQKAMSENTMLYFSNRLGYAGRNTINGLRTLASEVLSDSGLWYHNVIEEQLACTELNKIHRYNGNKYLKERRKMMVWWANYVKTIQNT
jgi:integrase